jgi:hypothetical protein
VEPEGDQEPARAPSAHRPFLAAAKMRRIRAPYTFAQEKGNTLAFSTRFLQWFVRASQLRIWPSPLHLDMISRDGLPRQIHNLQIRLIVSLLLLSVFC